MTSENTDKTSESSILSEDNGNPIARESKTQRINLEQLVQALEGDIAVQLTISQQSGILSFPKLPDNVTLEYNEETGTATLTGNAASVRLVLSELAFLPHNIRPDILKIDVEVIEAAHTETLELALSFQTDSNYYVPLYEHQSTGQIIPDLEAPEPIRNIAESVELPSDYRMLPNSELTLDEGSTLSALAPPSVALPDTTPESILIDESATNKAIAVNSPATSITIDTPDIPLPTTEEIAAASIPLIKDITSLPTGVNPAELTIGNIPSGGEIYDEDTTLDLEDISIEDSSGTVTITLTLSDIPAGTLAAPSPGTALSAFDALTGILTIMGDQADANAALADLQFIPNTDYDKDFSIAVEVTDGNSKTASDVIAMTANAVDDPVTLDAPLPDQAIDTGMAFSYTPTAIFGNPDTLDTLSYSATQTDSSTLPAWLTLDTTTGQLSGTPAGADIGTLSVRITADDGMGNSISDDMDIVISSSLDVTNINQVNSVTEDTSFDPPDIGIVTSEATATITLTLSDPQAGSLNTASSNAVTSTYHAGTGIWQASGAIADVNALLAGINFTPAADYDQDFTVSVSIDDGLNPAQTGTLTMNVTAVNDAPVLDSAETDKVTVATNVFSLDISGNFSDVDTGDSLTYTAQLAGGGALPAWLTLNPATGVFSGTPAVGDIATLDIIVTAEDSANVTVTDQFIVDMSAGGLIIGTPNADAITGTDAVNEIYGRGDNDTIYGKNGNDTIYGEDGDDWIDGGYHRDSIEGGSGNDTLLGSLVYSGNDRQDTLKGDAGDDYIDGGHHHDSLYGGAGNDTLFGNASNDRLYAGDGVNFLSGGTGSDQLHGETGSYNLMIGGTGRDVLYGGTGRDIFSYRSIAESSGGGRDDIRNFDQGTDIIDLSALGYSGIGDLTITQGGTTRITAADGFRIDVRSNVALNASDFIFSASAADIATTDQIAATGTAFNLPLTAGTFASIDDGNLVYNLFTPNGDAVNWWVNFDGSTGTLSGTPDTMHTGRYDVVLRATNGSNQVAEDTFSITVAENVILGTPAPDTLVGTANGDGIFGLADADNISSGDGADIVDGGDGNDMIATGNQRDTVYAGNGDDYIDGGFDRDTIYGGDGNDSIYGSVTYSTSDKEDYLYGEGGNDYINGGYHHDRLYGGTGNDTLIGGNNNDYLYAGDGNDILNGGAHNDRTYGGAGLNIHDGFTGTDYYYGGSGTDIYVFSDLTHSTADRIYNFDQGTDKIDLSKLGFTGIGDLNITQGGTTIIRDPSSNFRIDVKSNITLVGSDFIFASSASDGDIIDQTHITNTLFSTTLGAGHFASIDDGNLVYEVSLTSGSALPAWLGFNSASTTLSGTPTASGYYDITIRAINGSGDIATDQFAIAVGDNIITGTAGTDTLTGTAGNDVVNALADDDSITGGTGTDLVLAGAGNDTINAGNDRDTVYAGDGDDLIDGGFERDTLYGGDGNDTIYGSQTYSTSDREDYIYGEGGNDYIDGGYHHDRLYGGTGNDTLYGNNNNDYLYAGSGNDILLGGNNNDRLYGESGFNILDGGAHTDYYYTGKGVDIFTFSNLTHSTADRIYNFEQGTDKIDLSKLGLTGIGDLTITQGGTTTIVDPNSTFKINVMSNIALLASDFIFSVPAADGDLTLESVAVGSPLSVTTGAAHFSSIDDGNLVYTATLANGTPLPAWLTLDSSTGTFSGTPASTDTGALDIVLRATNASTAIAEDSFAIVIADAVQNGTAGNDTLTGTAANDGLLGAAGDDSLNGAAGSDILYGESGNDTLNGGDGLDTLNGGDGNDVLIGGSTATSDKQDKLYGAAGNDTLDGGYHHDTLYGGDGDDMVYGNRNNDSLYGGDGRDFLHGGNEQDRLYGEDGDDLLIGWHHRDSIWGGAGDDIIMITNRIYSAGGNRDILYDFTQGEDRIDLSMLGIDDINGLTFTTVGATTRITEDKSNFRIDIQDNLTLTAADFIFSGDVQKADIVAEPLITQTGSAFSQTLAAGSFASIDDGNIRYFGFQSNGNALPTWLTVDAGTGEISGTAPSATHMSITIRAVNGTGDIAEMTLGLGVSNSITTGTGANDTITGTNASDGFDGLAGDDLYTGNNGNDAARGGLGNDTLNGNNNDDFLSGGDGDDSIDGGFHRDLIFGGAGNDTLIGGSNTSNSDRQDTIFGGIGNDYIHGGRYHDELYGDEGSDTLIGGIHNDTLWGGDGADTLDGSQQNDVLYGESGADSLQGGNNNDSLYGGTGNDTLDGGAHRDVIWTGDGNDLITFSNLGHSGGGNIDRIMDFVRGNDDVDLTALGFTGIGDLTITNNGTITTVTDGGSFTFEIEGVHALDATDFLF